MTCASGHTLPVDDFDFSNLPLRPSGRGVQLAARLLPGVRETLAQVAPYAEAWSRHNRAAAVADGPLVVTLGDSMAQGIGASAYDKGWAGQLGARLGEPYRLVNFSAHGARTLDVLEHQWPAAQTLGPIDLVVCVIGANDLWKSRREALPGAFAQLLDVLPAGAVVSNQGNPRPEARAVERLIREAVVRKGVVLADMRSGGATSWRGKLAADHFHPNDAGYASMTDVLFDAVRRAQHAGL